MRMKLRENSMRHMPLKPWDRYDHGRTLHHSEIRSGPVFTPRLQVWQQRAWRDYRADGGQSLYGLYPQEEAR